jgi:hypothetical protein
MARAQPRRPGAWHHSGPARQPRSGAAVTHGNLTAKASPPPRAVPGSTGCSPQVPGPPGLRRVLWVATAGRRWLLPDGQHGGDRHGETHGPASTVMVHDWRHKDPAARQEPPARRRADDQEPRSGHRGDTAGAAVPTGPAPDGAPCPRHPPMMPQTRPGSGRNTKSTQRFFSPFLWTAKATSHKTLMPDRRSADPAPR